MLPETFELHTFKRWVGSAPWAKSSSTTARWPPAQARDSTVWSLLAVVLFTFAPKTDKAWKIMLIECCFLNYGKLQNQRVERTVLWSPTYPLPSFNDYKHGQYHFTYTHIHSPLPSWIILKQIPDKHDIISSINVSVCTIKR